MNLKKYEKKIEELKIESEKKLAAKEEIIKHKKVFASVMKKFIGSNLDTQDYENFKLIEEYPEEYRFASIFHDINKSGKYKKDE